MPKTSRLITLAALCWLFLITTAIASPAYPLKIGPTGRYLVDQKGVPFLIAGESPQAMTVNISEDDADLFFANRQSHGFNTAWVNLICAKYTGGRDDGSTTDGIRPFQNGWDFSRPNEQFFARCDRMIQAAAKHDILVMLDPAETGSFLAIMKSNGYEKCRAYGQYLGKRYATFDNILWFHGNDYNDTSEANDKLVTAIALGIRDFDDRHLHTIETNPDNGGRTSLDDERWTPIVGLSGAYSYGPVYVPILRDYNRKSDHRVPTFLIESSYEFEHLSGAQLGTPRQLRWQEYSAILSGAAGQLYGNKYTWPFLPGWKEKLDTPGAVQMANVKALFEPRAWHELVPDQDNALVTEGRGKFGTFDYVSAARTPNGKLAMAFVPGRRTIAVDMSRMSGPAVARWYDPASGRFKEIEGSPLANQGIKQLESPGENADGSGNEDWVLVLETRVTSAATTEPARQPSIPTLWIVGDSTVHNPSKTEEGWGEPLIKMFDPQKVRVINRAMGGRSSRTFQREGRWDAILREAQPGDFVLIQMGHNDGGPLAGDNRERGTIRGIGDETKDVTLHDGTKETVHTYGWYMRKYIADARAKGMTPIICSWVPHCPAAGQPIAPEGEPTSYRAYAKQVAEQEITPFIDLYAITWHKYMKMSADDVKKTYFTDADNTHTSPAGAQVNAQSVVEGLKELKDVPLAGYIVARATSP